MVVLSIDESIQRLKAEIIAPDWRLSPKRAELLAAAFACLKNRFKAREGIYAILVMAENVLNYIKKMGPSHPPGSIDFLKEAMAQVVNGYEDFDFDPGSEKIIFQEIRQKFNLLKDRINKVENRRDQTSAEVRPEAEAKDAADRFAPGSGTETAASLGRKKSEVDLLVSELKIALAKAEKMSAVLHGVIADDVPPPPDHFRHPELNDQAVMVPAPGTAEAGPGPAAPDISPPGIDEPEGHRVKSCYAAEIRPIVIAGTRFGIGEGFVAMIGPLARKKCSIYLKERAVPLKDFRPFFGGLPRRFRGPLSRVRPGKLKKMRLPVIMPRGFDLPDAACNNASNLIVLSSGHWHGVILCGEVGRTTGKMTRFQKARDADIDGAGYLDGGERLLLLNVGSVLRREGSLLMV